MASGTAGRVERQVMLEVMFALGLWGEAWLETHVGPHGILHVGRKRAGTVTLLPQLWGHLSQDPFRGGGFASGTFFR